MHSLFEEQIEGDFARVEQDIEAFADIFVEASTFFPRPVAFALGPDAYLEQVRRIRAAVRVPVIASLNGTTRGGWLRYARLLEQAGANALELNFYSVATDPHVPADAVEKRAVDIVSDVVAAVRIPVAVKLSPFFSSLPHFAAALVSAGARGLVLFNRFYQPDFDVDALDVVPSLRLSDPSELLLRLHWLAILSGRVGVPMAVSGGVHGSVDAVKALMAGASSVQIVSAILRSGPSALTAIRDGLLRWLEEHEYESLAQLRGSLDFSRCPDPAAFERGNYMRVLQGYRRRTP
jgi:dihydroorotate dehydrogenase (fumarate)